MARLDLQTMLNTYPDSEYRMRAKLAVGDTWFKEGGTGSPWPRPKMNTRTSSPSFHRPLKRQKRQMKVGDIYYQQMEEARPRLQQCTERRARVPDHDQYVPGLVANPSREAKAS